MPSSAPPTIANQRSTTARSVVAGDSRIRSSRNCLAANRLELRARARIQGQLEERLIPFLEQIEDHIRRGKGSRQRPDPRGCRVDPLQKRLEVDRASNRNDQLAVEHEARRLELRDGRHDFGKVACQRLSRLGLQLHLAAVAEGNASEAVPLRFVLPLRAAGDLLDDARLHRGERRTQTQRHSAWSSLRRSNRPRAPGRTGAQRSPRFSMRARALAMVKSSISMPASTSSHSTGIDTGARGRGRTE